MSASDAPVRAPEVREVSAPRREAGRLSSELYDLLRVKGRTTAPGPGVGPCGDLDPDTFYVIRHPWSVYGVPADELRTAWEGLREDLPRHGWTIVTEGREETVAAAPYLIADCARAPFTLKATLLIPTARDTGRGAEPGIGFTLVSACFRVPEGGTVAAS
ncbi:hypothetical protein [Streptomyces cucumeris]|uniref:hypothetical protein n=1 Tax=Streptomyces cucumeris TaxID=2962890 RepID=UPI0020C8A0DC|nr:hypothetical protein [Streptomyces sp. NEAU-Y11]MCP9205709.1 hypothetical protein [Streptomyces sp. NEAU-Y11]